MNVGGHVTRREGYLLPAPIDPPIARQQARAVLWRKGRNQRGALERGLECVDQLPFDREPLEMLQFPCRKALAVDQAGKHPRRMPELASNAVRIAKEMEKDKIGLKRRSREHQHRRVDTYAKELAKPAEIPAIPTIGADTPVDVLRRRPDIIAAERRLAASNEQIGAAIADYYPKISLSGALGFDSISANHLFTGKAFQAISTGAISWRLFDFGKVDAEVASARGANAEALAQYRQSVLKAAEDVEDALVSLSQTEAHVVELEGEVGSLARSRDLSQKAYQAGSIVLTDVLDADRQLLIARDELDSNRADAARAAVRTFRALGGGWDAPPVSQVAERS
jgi:hypothetical protein